MTAESPGTAMFQIGKRYEFTVLEWSDGVNYRGPGPVRYQDTVVACEGTLLKLSFHGILNTASPYFVQAKEVHPGHPVAVPDLPRR
jgi:hypothetical protein